MDTPYYFDWRLRFPDCGCSFLENGLNLRCQAHLIEYHRYDNEGVFKIGKDGNLLSGPGGVKYKKTIIPVFSYPDKEIDHCC